MPSLAPPPDQLARFARDLEALTGMPERLGLAVSGGPDSLALLLLAAAALPGRVEAATVDHGLRAESAVEALHAADICARLGCPHAVLAVAVPDGPAGLQGEARRARYDALGGWGEARGLAHLATAHHQDDQAETVLMRLRRGSGVAGLGGIRPVRSEGGLVVVRPLLGWTKAELVRLVAAAGIEPADDPSNRDPRFDRTAARRFLADHPGFEPGRLARSAAACREADAALAWAARELAEDRITSQGGEWRIDPSGLPRELQRRLLARAIAEIRSAHGLDPPWTGGEDVEALLAALAAGEAGTLAGVMARGGPAWHLRLAPPRRPAAAKA
ncbi:MAG TPA: tRNA lysidine(34) synthetase TilS [Allosphingosinicella sp.]|nr:tRNA lysidine(34) synthetase TilS [Allosphingosinicella sp.]